MHKKIANYFSKHVMFNSTVHLIGGMGLGILLTFPLFIPHPVRWGILLLALAFLGHLYALKAKK